MLFSEAVMLGSTTGHKLSNRSWNHCLIGMSVSALAECDYARQEAELRWPWLLQEVDHKKLPACIEYLSTVSGSLRNGFLVATSLCAEVLNNNITLEQAVDAIRMIEPPEPQVAEEIVPEEEYVYET